MGPLSCASHRHLITPHPQHSHHTCTRAHTSAHAHTHLPTSLIFTYHQADTHSVHHRFTHHTCLCARSATALYAHLRPHSTHTRTHTHTHRIHTFLLAKCSIADAICSANTHRSISSSGSPRDLRKGLLASEPVTT